MSEASRQRWLFIHNRMEELNAKYGPVPDEPLPPWLDSLEGFRASAAQQAAQRAQEQTAPTEPPVWWSEEQHTQNRVLEPPRGQRVADW